MKANIECVGCALDINGDGVVDSVDTTIIARHLAGFQGASLTAGLALGNGTRPDVASVVSFLANGCAVGGAINAFVQNGNSFGAPAVLGTNDSQPVTVKTNQSTIKLLVDPANGDDGLRISYAAQGSDISPNTVNGSRTNSVAAGIVGATIAGGGKHDTAGADFPNQINGNYGTIGGGYRNTIASSGYEGTISGGFYNSVSGPDAVVGGGISNTAGAGSGSQSQTVAGGNSNVASGDFSAVPGGLHNTAGGSYSFAAGRRAKATNQGAFVWGDSTDADVTATGNDQFVIRANGGIRLPGAGENQPNNPTKQSGTNVFTHVVPASGPCNTVGGFGLSRTAIDHPLTNGKPNAILVVTANIGVRTQNIPFYAKPVDVMYDDDGGSGCTVSSTGRWMIVNPNGDQNMVAGMKFNVFVINP